MDAKEVIGIKVMYGNEDLLPEEVRIVVANIANAACATVGIEVELLAPAGSDRRALAELIAKRLNGSVRAFFHTDSEPSKVQGKPLFYHLTQGFAVHDAHGKLIAKCVDDITLQHDLNKDAPAAPGWYRLVSDEIRLLRLIARHSQADLLHCCQLTSCWGIVWHATAGQCGRGVSLE